MKKSYTKIFILGLCVALLFCCTLSPVASADISYTDKQRFAAMVGAALSALNITMESMAAPVIDAYNYLADPFDVVYTSTDEYLHDYFDKSTIQVYDKYVYIDDVAYTDIWFGNKPADIFRVNAGDLETAWNITSNSSGNAASGAGYINGLPAFNLDGSIRTQSTFVPVNTSSSDLYFSFGDSLVGSRNSGSSSSPNFYVLYRYQDGLTYSRRYTSLSSWPIETWFAPDPQSASNKVSWVTSSGSSSSSGAVPGSAFVSFPFDYDWVSGVIPADPIPDSDTGLMIRVPSADVQDWVDEHPSYTQPGGTTINIENPGVSVEIDDLIDKLIPLIPVIPVGDINFSKQHDDAPSPDPDPDPEVDPDPIPVPDGTLLPSTPWDNLKHRLDRIIESINNAPDRIIKSIGDLGDSILKDIQKGPIDIFDKGLDLLRDIFLPFFQGLAGALGIWHYVVDWLSAISGAFSWLTTVIFGASGIIALPIYASIAGIIVISIYRRFGR